MNHRERHDHNAVAMVNEKLREIIERVGQNIEGRWPFFMENSDGDLLMISKPESGWDYVMLATNDTKKIERISTYSEPEITVDSTANKTLWWLTDEQVQRNRGFVPLYEDAKNGSPKLYIRNLSNKSKIYTHVIESSDNKSQFLDAYNDTVLSLTYDQSRNRREDIPEFSPVRIAYTKGKQITEFNCVIAKKLGNTSNEALVHVKQNLPGLPSLINAKFVNFSNDFSLEPPEAKIKRSPNTFISNPDQPLFFEAYF